MASHLLVTNDYPPKTGGIQVYLHELWTRLESGRAVVVTADSHRDAAQFDAASSVVIERLASATVFLPTPKILRAIEAAIERHQPDLVLLDPAWPLGLLGPQLSRPYGSCYTAPKSPSPADYLSWRRPCATSYATPVSYSVPVVTPKLRADASPRSTCRQRSVFHRASTLRAFDRSTQHVVTTCVVVLALTRMRSS
jgi:hypothetical protein